MTRAEILAMPAGPELDAEVAIRVMGWTACGDIACGGCDRNVYLTAKGWEVTLPDGSDYFRPSVSWESMGLVVEAMHARGECLSLTWKTGVYVASDEEPANASGNASERFGWEAWFRHANAFAVADTAPLATARAALLACGEVSA